MLNTITPGRAGTSRQKGQTMWNADCAVEEHYSRMLAQQEREERAYERALEIWAEQNGPLYHFSGTYVSPDAELVAYARESFGKALRDLTPAQAELVIRHFYDVDAMRDIEVLGDGTICFSEGELTDDWDGETVSGQRFEMRED